jgi:hypothetical protein
MGPKPSVNYWKSRKGYLCCFRGKQVLLCSGPDDGPTGPTYLKALEEFQKLLKGEERRQAEGLTVREVLERYLLHISKKRSAGTVEIRHRSLMPFVNYADGKGCFGERLVHALANKWTTAPICLASAACFMPWLPAYRLSAARQHSL